MRRFFLFLTVLSLVVGPFEYAPDVLASYSRPPVSVQIIGTDGSVLRTFSVPSANEAGGASVAVADLGTDGTAEIIVGNGLGNEPRVHAFRDDGSEIGSFLAYDGSMGVGVNVAACDLDGDGVNEIVTVPMRGAAPQVRVFSNFGTLVDPGFYAYAESMTAGVNLACGDLDGDGRAELATLPAAGAGSDVKIWRHEGASLSLAKEFFVFDANDARGIVGTIVGQSLRVSAQRGRDHETFTYKLSTDAPTASIPQTDDALGATGMFSSGARTYRTTANGQIIDADSFVTSSYETSFGSIAAAGGDVDGDGSEEIVAVESRVLYGGSATGKDIIVDISEQRLYASENGLVEDTFLISTARAPYVTPLGHHEVTAKIPLVHYAGGSGADAYDLGWIPYNLRFYTHIYIHYAPWNHSFGQTLSHGCVNVSLDDIKWIYNWADVGVPVDVQT